MIAENGIKIIGKVEDTVSKKMEVFYNPIMKLNRDISVLLLKAIDKKEMQIGLPLSGSGIRGIRFLKELESEKIKRIYFNDYREGFEKELTENFKLNGVAFDSEQIIISNQEASKFLLSECGFDYIDIDPFGSPNPFLDGAIKRISRGGVLAVTATDTSALCGTYPKVCRRKYWAEPCHDFRMHEFGLRILIRKVQLIGVQFEKAMIPVFSYSRDHYMRVFFLCFKGKKKCDDVLKAHSIVDGYGPLWTGAIFDSELVDKMFEKNLKSELIDTDFMNMILKESKINLIGFYDIWKSCSKLKITCPKFEKIFDAVSSLGFKLCRTHFSECGLKTNMPEEQFLDILKKL
ncbi:hypothetical protein HOK51_07365 [Candidatus Woesearchaeota archaeon]|jgi:tRNA (guanine26-N2/guanine27-N2)-dimethyltransferase|nr:hypothetical protein [Candidatus Woesearchaeota archaeon]MBT6519641.1 hypothetical protein [Candidatus Woesearchaeota archaeon]MBT7367556.1 hypothetical protein [Candidatus Woesearchaeota archaeon]